MDESISQKLIPFYDRKQQRNAIRYGDLMIDMGEDRQISLSDALLEEKSKVAEFNRIADRLTDKVKVLAPFYDAIEKDPIGFHAEMNRRRQSIHKLSHQKRIHALNTYYTLNSTHAKVLTNLTKHLLAGSEGDHSAHAISLMKRAMDYMCSVMRHVPRKTKRAAAIHSIEAARGAAKNGLREITIIPTLLHDVLEEKLDIWTERLIDEELQDPAYGECCGKTMREVPVALRHRIIQKYIDDYNDHASGIYFEICLMLYDHIRHFPNPTRYYETLISIMDIVAALSRRRDSSYYSYLRDLLYPKPDASMDTIPRSRLLAVLSACYANPDELLDEYMQNVASFYDTALGEFSAKEEVRRNAFREILAKILDRLNNTRDMERGLGFSVSKRLYGTGFKNIFFLQALEDKLQRPGFNTEERRLIEVKFINKPKVAALYQIIEDIEYIAENHLGEEMITFLENEINRYRGTRDFRRLTPPGRAGYFNGLIYLFNEVTLGRKSSLIELEKRHDKQAEVLVAFKAVLESFLVYPALIREEQQAKGFKRISQSAYRPYRIEAMGPGLEHRSNVRKEQAVDLLNLRTFNRQVV
ncbi:MAG: hypothetical protein JXR96_08290 [Deltaproteobacteria bacterium]|nr:hypothetical protein [Deltaproteobacteria bacterium]